MEGRRDAAAPPGGRGGAGKLCWERWARERRPQRGRRARRLRLGPAEDDPAANALLAALFGNSRYLSHCLIADQPFARVLVEQGPEAAFADARALAEDTGELGAESKQQAMKRLQGGEAPREPRHRHGGHCPGRGRWSG